MARVWFLLALLPPWKGGRALCLTYRICQFPLLLRTHCLFWDSLPENAFILLSLLRSPLSWFLQLFPGLPRGLLCSEVYGERARKRPRTCTLSLAIFPLKCVFQCSFCVCVCGGAYILSLCLRHELNAISRNHPFMTRKLQGSSGNHWMY